MPMLKSPKYSDFYELINPLALAFMKVVSTDGLTNAAVMDMA